LTPIAKLYTAKQAVATCSEVLEAFGGAGYIEDTGLPRLLRDAQVLSIWEGTTNILSLDALRAISREQAFAPLMAHLDELLGSAHRPELKSVVDRTERALARIKAYLPRALDAGEDVIAAGARGFAYSLARTTIAALLARQAAWSLATDGDGRALASAQRWSEQELAPLLDLSDAARQNARALALDQPFDGTQEVAQKRPASQRPAPAHQDV
jgi:hypothetical protein